MESTALLFLTLFCHLYEGEGYKIIIEEPVVNFKRTDSFM